MTSKIKVTNVAAEIETVRAGLAEAERLLTDLKVREELLERRLARGTGDVTDQARAAVAASTTALPARIERVLREQPRSLDDLVLALEEPAGRVATALRSLRKSGLVYNVGTEDRAVWLWVIGDEGSPEELASTVKMLIGLRPFTFPELLEATGARRGRVSGVIVQLQRTGQPVMNLGNGRHARWFLPSPEALKRLQRRA